MQRHLKQQGGFADARFAAQKDDGTADDAAAQHAVELGESGLRAREFRKLNVIDDLGGTLRDNRGIMAF